VVRVSVARSSTRHPRQLSRYRREQAARMAGGRARVTPWASRAEWEAVRELVRARSPLAVDHLAVWGARAARLPAGAETTLGLLRAHLALPHTALSLATALNRWAVPGQGLAADVNTLVVTTLLGGMLC
jgi:hypothetical protein